MTVDQLENEIRALSDDDRAELLERFGLIAPFRRSRAKRVKRPLPVCNVGSPENWVAFRVGSAEAGEIEGIFYFDPLLIELSKRFQQKAYTETRSGERANDGPTLVAAGEGEDGFKYAVVPGPMEPGVPISFHLNARNLLFNFEEYREFFSAALKSLADYIEHKVMTKFQDLRYAGPNLEPRTLRYSEKPKERRDRIRKLPLDLPLPRGGSQAEYNLSALSQHYSQTHPKWIRAKEIYNKSGKGKGWQKTVSGFDPDLPEDLIECLDECNLTELQPEASQKGMSSMPADLALEHAARLCGSPPFHYSIFYLKRLKGQSTSN